MNKLSQWTLLSWWMRRKRKRRQLARNTFISTIQNIFSPSKPGWLCFLCFFLITGMVDGRQFLNNGWVNTWFHFFRITPSGDKELTSFKTATNPGSQVWPHWIWVGNANLLGLCTLFQGGMMPGKCLLLSESTSPTQQQVWHSLSHMLKTKQSDMWYRPHCLMTEFMSCLHSELSWNKWSPYSPSLFEGFV